MGLVGGKFDRIKKSEKQMSLESSCSHNPKWVHFNFKFCKLSPPSSMSYVNILSQPNHNHNPNYKTTITVVGLRQSNWTIMVFTFVIISKSERRTIGARKTITKKWLTWYIYIPVSFNIIMNRLHNFELSSSC